MTGTIRGIIPPMTTPFTAEGEIDEAAFRRQVRFFLEHGVHGVCVGGSTGDGHTLTREEFRSLIAWTVEEVRGRVPVIAGIIANSTREAILRAGDIAHLDIAALQITPVHYLFRPDEAATFDHFRTLAAAVAPPILIYNVIPWNYLAPAQLLRIMREIPGVIGVKQSQGDLKLMADLLLDVPPGKLILTAVDALLYPSFALGSPGTIAAMPTAIPGPCLALWEAVQRGDHATARDLHARMLRFWNAIVGDNLPACTKYALAQQGCPVGVPRAPMPPASPAQRAAIDAALRLVLGPAAPVPAAAAQ
jgi:4-hydroxy-tetrahydrodipicolinate synthase